MQVEKSGASLAHLKLAQLKLMYLKNQDRDDGH
jgi:hypothetical protein